MVGGRGVSSTVRVPTEPARRIEEGRQAGGREEFLDPLEPHTSESLAILQALLGICMHPALPGDRREVWAV